VGDEFLMPMLITHKENYEKKRVEGTVVVNGEKFAGAGIRFKGNSSFFSAYRAGKSKLPLNLKLSYTDKSARYAGRYKTLKLSNVFRDPSYIREVFAYTVARRYVPAPAANFAKVTINGEYWGLYNLSQSIDEQFQEDYYGSKNGLLFKCDPSWQENKAVGCQEGDKSNLAYLGKDIACYTDKYELKRADEGWEELVEFTRILNLEPEKLEEIMNVDEALWMLAFNNVMVNLDSYNGRLCHNYYLYQDTNRYWHPLLWDMNLSLGGFRFTGLGGRLDNEQLANLSLFLHLKEKNQRRPLITKLLGKPLYRKMYVAHAKTMYEDFFAEDQYKVFCEKLREKLRPIVEQDTQKLYSVAAFDQNFTESVIVDKTQQIIGIEELIEGRKAYLSEHP
ncbi:MAG: CotH kinase family protein, partial [Bacteroidota bacterium]